MLVGICFTFFQEKEGKMVRLAWLRTMLLISARSFAGKSPMILIGGSLPALNQTAPPRKSSESEIRTIRFLFMTFRLIDPPSLRLFVCAVKETMALPREMCWTILRLLNNISPLKRCHYGIGTGHKTNGGGTFHSLGRAYLLAIGHNHFIRFKHWPGFVDV